ncbi:MAG TPA: hypothetical protein VL974_07330 [Magnetospirillum sp.]|jgi:hypothetical protein|nr:hypothetical protein [Magnetospirillum sp.]
MAAWINQGIRIDVALAVVMEVAVLQLNRAESVDDRKAAISFNNSLWQVVGDIASTSPVNDDRSALAGAASLVGKGLDVEQVTELNRRFARLLAGRAATDGALGQILGKWRTAQAEGGMLEFGPWLLQLLGGFIRVKAQALAA